MISPLVLLLVVLGLASATPVQDCGSTANIDEVRIEGCDAPPCLLIRGEDAHVEIEFVNNQASETLSTEIIGTIGGLDVPWFGADPNACNGLTSGDCPLENGEKTVYETTLPVLNEYPPVSVVITWKLVNDAGATAVCFIVPALII